MELTLTKLYRSDVAFDFNPQDNITTGGNAVTSNFTWEITQITGTVSGVMWVIQEFKMLLEPLQIQKRVL